MIQPFYLACLAHASYVVADEASGVAAVVDPQRDIDQYLEFAQERGLELRYVILTHFHADFVSGHIELREKTGAEVVVGPRAQPEFAHRVFAEGDAIDLGDQVRLTCLETPGHTPEGISIVVRDRTQGDAPQAVFTGDTLFIGDVGRPDLLASVGVTAQELGEMLYDSLHEKLMKLPDATLVYPAHGAGSMCGKNLSSETVSTIGAQRANNYALQPMSKADFVALVSADQPTAPAYFPYDAVLNKKERPTIDDAVQAGTQALDVDAFLALRDAGAQVVDTRDEVDFAAGAVAGAFSLPLSGSFATWSGALLKLDAPIVLIVEPGKEHEAATRLARIGIDTAKGYLAGGIAALAGRGDVLQTSARTTAEELRKRIDAGEELTVLDVRTPGEWEGGHIDHAIHVPLIELPKRFAEVPRDRRVFVVCRSGARSGTAVSLLKQQGFDDVVNVAGGMNAFSGAAACAGS